MATSTGARPKKPRRRGEKQKVKHTWRDDDTRSPEDKELEKVMTRTTIYRRPDNTVMLLLVQEMDPVREELYQLIDILTVVKRKYKQPRCINNIVYYLQEDLLRCLDGKNYLDVVNMLYDSKACYHYVLNSFFREDAKWWNYYITAITTMRLALQQSCFERKHFPVEWDRLRPDGDDHALDPEFEGSAIIDDVMMLIGRPCGACGEMIYPFGQEKLNRSASLARVRFRAGIRLTMSGKFIMSCSPYCEDLLHKKSGKAAAAKKEGFAAIERLAADAPVPSESMQLFTREEKEKNFAEKPWVPRDITKLKTARVNQPKPKPVKPWTMMTKKEINREKGGIESQFNVHLRMVKDGNEYILESAYQHRKRRAALGYKSCFSYAKTTNPADVVDRAVFEHFGRVFREYRDGNEEALFSDMSDKHKKPLTGFTNASNSKQCGESLKESYWKCPPEERGPVTGADGLARDAEDAEEVDNTTFVLKISPDGCDLSEASGDIYGSYFKEPSVLTKARNAIRRRSKDIYVLPKKICITCGASSSNMKKCGSCLLVYYCSPHCQKIDLEPHRGICAREVQRRAEEEAEEEEEEVEEGADEANGPNVTDPIDNDVD